MVYNALLCAVEDGASIEVIRSLLEAAPEEDLYSVELFVVIEAALRNQVNSETLRLIIDADPDPYKSSLVEQDVDGDTLLHTLCRQNAHHDVLKVLLEFNADALHFDNDVGFLPLHCACHFESSASTDVVAFLIEKYPKGVRTTCNNGLLPLHYACDASKWDAVNALLTSYPKGVRVTDGGGRLPFHYVCQKNAPPLDLFVRLVKMYPRCIMKADRSGRLPFHHACEGSLPLEVVSVLLKLYPEAIHAADRDLSRLPLHLACRSRPDPSLISLLVETYPLALMKKTTQGRTPLLQAYYNDEATEEVKALLLREQERVAQSLVDAIKDAGSGFKGFDGFIVKKIWELAYPVLWYPSNVGSKC